MGAPATPPVNGGNDSGSGGSVSYSHPLLWIAIVLGGGGSFTNGLDLIAGENAATKDDIASLERDQNHRRDELEKRLATAVAAARAASADRFTGSEGRALTERTDARLTDLREDLEQLEDRVQSIDDNHPPPDLIADIKALGERIRALEIQMARGRSSTNG